MELIFDVSKKKILDALHVLQDSVKSLVHWFSTSSGTMDFHTSVICVIVFIISALVVYLISVFGMRERTYEEAIEEQRQRNKEAIQQAKSDKTKKEKKFKKWGKKGREKVDDDKPIIAAESEEKVGHEVDSAVGGEVNVTNLDQKNKCFISRRKIKLTALVSNNKENAIFQIPSSSEENDEQHSTSRSSSSSPQKDELVAADLPKILKGKINYAGGKFGKQLIDCEGVSNTFSDAFVANECDESCVSINTSQQVEDKSCSALSETHIEFNRKLISALKVACLSADDLYELTSFLMCKELPLCPMSLDVPSKKSVGSNGSITAEDKVKDLCQKLSQERSNSAATEAFFRDKLSQQRQELQSLQEKIRRSHEQQLSGSSTVKTKIQQLRTKLTEDHAVIVQKLQEEKNQLQQAYDILEKQKCNNLEISRLQQEVEQSRVSTEEYETQLASMQQIQDDLHRQIQQMESHIEQLVNSKQDEEFSLKQRISELNSKLQQSEKSQGPLVQELKNLKTVCGTLESDNASARKRFEEAKKQIGNMEQDVHKLQSKLEESHQQQRELTNCLEQMQNEVIDLKNIQNDHLQQIEDLKQENQSISSQLVGAEKIISTEASDIHHMPKKKEIDLEEHLKMMQEKDAFLLHYSEELSKSEANLLVVSEEVEYLKLQNQEIQEKNRKISTTLSVAEKKLHDIMEKLEDKEKEIVIILSKKTKEIEQALYEKHIKDIDSKNDELKILQVESRNKAVASEKRVEELEKLFYQRVNEVEIEAEHRVHEMLKRSEHILSLLKRDREVLKKMFPDINISSSLDHETWILQFEEKAINNIIYLKENSLSTSWLGDKDNLLKQLTEALEEKSKFELRAKHYKSALVDTGNVLSKLQSTAEMEEKIFKQKLLTLEMELKKVLSEYKKLSNDTKNLSDNGVEEIYSQQKLKIELEKLQSELKLKEDQNLEAKEKINELKIEMNKLQSKHTGDEYKKQVFPPTMFVDHSSTDAGISVTSGQATMNVPGTYPAKSEKRKKTKKKGSSGKK